MGEDNAFKVRSGAFEGPLEVLLTLIEKRKLHINDVSLASVTDDFIDYMNEQRNVPLSQSTSFIWVASALLLLKSKSLLPTLTLSQEEEGDIQSLELRLKLYEYFKKLTPHITRRFGTRILFGRATRTPSEPVFSPDKTCTIVHLHVHISTVLTQLPKKERVKEALVERIVSLEEMIEELSERIAQNLSISFKEFAQKQTAEGKEKKLTVIVGFLAMLELVKRGVLDVKQEANFSDITMETERVNTPRYT